MTNEEAIERIQKRICCESPVQHFCTDACMDRAEFCEIALALYALQKQIPRSGTGVITTEDSKSRYCPRCKNYVGLIDSIIDRKNRGYSTFCTYCGQRIKEE